MASSDPVGDMLAMIKNAYGRRHKPMATDGRIHTGQLKDLFA